MKAYDDDDDLENVCIGTKEGWDQIVHAQPVPRPDALSCGELSALSTRAKRRYDDARNLWHANTGVLRTNQLEELHGHLWDVMEGSRQRGNSTKGAVALEGDSSLGKTTAVEQFAKEYHLRVIEQYGPRTPEGHERWPVARVTLSGHPTMKALNKSLAYYFAHPARTGNAEDYARAALELFQSCRVRLLIIDDLHHLRWTTADGEEVTNHLKFLANVFPITLILIGTHLTKRGLYRQGLTFGEAVLGPTARRTTPHKFEPFDATSTSGDTEWRTVLHAVEGRLVLPKHRFGTLSDDLSDYLFARTTGYIGSLMTLLNRAATRAMRTGEEALTEELLEMTKIDRAADEERETSAAQLRVVRRNRERTADNVPPRKSADGPHAADPR